MVTRNRRDACYAYANTKTLKNGYPHRRICAYQVRSYTGSMALLRFWHVRAPEKACSCPLGSQVVGIHLAKSTFQISKHIRASLLCGTAAGVISPHICGLGTLMVAEHQRRDLRDVQLLNSLALSEAERRLMRQLRNPSKLSYLFYFGTSALFVLLYCKSDFRRLSVFASNPTHQVDGARSSHPVHGKGAEISLYCFC